MKRMFALSTALLVTLAASACGGGDDAGEEPGAADTPSTEGTAPAQPGDTGAGAQAGEMPSWFRVNGNQVEIDLVAGSTPDNNYWNFNGGTNGSITINVPEGAQVTINFRNDDPNMAHSAGIAPFTASPPASPAAESVFEGAITSNPTSMTEATMTGQSETITFTAGQAGEYALLCYVPGHAVSGMWLRFNVGGEAGVTGAS